MSNTSTNTVVEYAICFGDGEVDDNNWRSLERAERQIEVIRRWVNQGSFDADDYPEPMKVVTRSITTTVTATPWEDAR